MILSQHVIKGASTPVTICPLGDIQWAGDRNDLAFDSLQEHIARCLALPNPKFVGLGDYIDFASPSNREALAHAKLYDTARKVIADATKNLTDELYDKVLKPTKGMWLGMVNGHHHMNIPKVGDSDEYLADKLGAPFCHELGLVQLRWDGGAEVNILFFHGDGGSVFPWGPLNKLFRISPNFDADILLMGHQTKKAVGEYDFISPVFPTDSEARLEHRTRHLVGTGGWTKGYVHGKQTYVSAGMYPPVALGQPIVHVRPTWRTSTATGAKVWSRGITVEV